MSNWHKIFIAIFLLVNFNIKAQDKPVTASAPSVVTMGEAFNYTISGDFDGKVTLPEMKGFRVVSGPSTFVSQQATNTNGKLQMVRQVTYSYTLLADEEGEFTIPPAKIISGRKEYLTNELNIKVIKGTKQAQPVEPDQSNTAQAKSETIFVDLVPSSKTIYLGEQFLLTSKIYTQEALQISEVKAPALEGLWKEDLKTDETSVRETYNGQNYLTLVFSRSLLTPQKAGEITINPIQVTCLVQKKVKSRSPYDFFNDPFFNDPFFDRVQTVEQSVRSNALVIDVKPLPPGPPAGFSGAVGTYSMKASLNKEQARVNDAITLRLTISGRGNLMLLKPVKIDFPPDLELFDPKTVQDIKHSASGTTGSVNFDYLLIPRHSGKFRISPIVFSYFDPSDKKYHSLQTGEFNFTVEASGEEDESFISAPGSAGAQGRIQGGKGENVVSLANDIQFIKLTPPRLRQTGKSLFGSVSFILVYILATVMFAALVIIRKETIRRNADINAVRNRKARKIAEKRLVNASRMMKTQDEGFYEEILRALWGYLTDKLGINISDLSRDVINEKLKSLAVPEQIMTDLWKVMDDCELARYGAGFSGEKHEIYNSTIKIISELQEIIN